MYRIMLETNNNYILVHRNGCIHGTDEVCQIY